MSTPVLKKISDSEIERALPKWYNRDMGGDAMNVLRDLRKSRNLSQKQVADYLQCSNVVYSRYETGAREPPRDVIVALANFYSVSTDYLLGTSDNPSPTAALDARDEEPDPYTQRMLALSAKMNKAQMKMIIGAMEGLLKEE